MSTLGRKDIEVISEQKVAELVLAAPVNLKAGIRFSAFTGVRLGEALWLQDVFGATPGRFNIDWQLSKAGGRKLPKGGHRRTIIVPPEALPAPVDGKLIPLSRTAHHEAWDATRARVGLPKLHWHDLRHFAATWWLGRFAENGRPGVDPYAMTAIQLGHRDGGELCRRLYGHYREIALDELARLVA